MAHETGSATSPTDLLQKLVTWLVARGWTQNMSQADSLGWRAHLSKGGIYVNLRSNIGSGTEVWGHGLYTTSNYDGIGLYVGTGFSSGAAWHAQPGGPVQNGQTYTVGAWMKTPAGAIIAYQFFDDGADNILVVVERTAGIFTNMAWGPSITKAGVWTGGAYFSSALAGFFGAYATGVSALESARAPFAYNSGSYPSFLRVDVDSFTGKWVGFGSSTTAPYGYTGKLGAGNVGGDTPPADIPRCTVDFMARQTSSMNSQANLVPIWLYAQRDGGGYSVLGRLPSVYASNASTKGFAIGSTFQIGADTYMVFPNFVVKKVS